MTTLIGAPKTAPAPAPGAKTAPAPAPGAKPAPAPKPLQLHAKDSFEPAKRRGQVSRTGTNDDSI